MTAAGRSPEEIQREIGETQANLARTIASSGTQAGSQRHP